jgi:hypothetical protein
MTPVLSRRALGRATLARRFLLARTDQAVPEVVTHLVGLQAQTPHTWYTGLWSRVAGFTPDLAADLLVSRELVRIAVMRSTIHPVTAEDALKLRPVVQPVLERDVFRNFTHGRDLQGLDVTPWWPPGACCRPRSRAPTRSWAPCCTSGGRTALRPRWPTRSAAWWRWCRCRRAGCGVAVAPSRTRASRRGWASRWRTSLRRTLSTMDEVGREGGRLPAFLAPDVPKHEVRTTSPAVPRP